MRKIVLMMSVSLDGYMEGPDQDISWHRVDDEVHRSANDAVRDLGGLLFGRVTYDLMEGFWPTADEDPDVDPVMADFARIYREIPKYVYSRMLRESGRNTTIVRDVVPEEVRALKEQPGGDLGLGGADLGAVFLEQGLVDEIRLYVHPVLIGRGKPMFREGDATIPLTLIGSRTFGNGVTLLHYAVDA
ncbi:dihydrofolate reductase family protein [Streptomyces sp. NPDC002920]